MTIGQAAFVLKGVVRLKSATSYLREAVKGLLQIWAFCAAEGRLLLSTTSGKTPATGARLQTNWAISSAPPDSCSAKWLRIEAEHYIQMKGYFEGTPDPEARSRP